MKALIKIFLFIIFAGSLLVLNAQKKDYSKEPGYFDYGDLSSFESEDSGTEVYLEEHLLKMVAKMTSKEDQNLSSLIGDLKLVRVNRFEIEAKNDAKIKNKILGLEKELISKNWDKIVRHKSKGESADIYIKTLGDNRVCGLVVMSYTNNKEAVFVNIMGNIDMDKIGQLSEKFDIPGLGDAYKKPKEKTKK